MNMEYLAVALLSCLVGACGINQKTEAIQGDMPFVEGTPTKTLLQEVPDLIGVPTDGEGNPVKITVAVYKFPDVTGQRKQVGLSTAVSQGADVWVIQALMAVSGGDWFTVVERASLDNVVKERQLIRSTRELYDGAKTIASTSNGADVFKFLDLGTRALEIESGNATNEPVNYAIRTAIEYAVLQMVHEGKELGLWEWELPVIEETQTINIVDSHIPLDEWAKHPIELKQQGE